MRLNQPPLQFVSLLRLLLLPLLQLWEQSHLWLLGWAQKLG